ncbi:MAG: ribosome small subunit-dependent GTPase A, partial [Alloprevotella sp.]|nr:ribosome small subunit-dependent GTPase A [Alloprevotella sp.]
MHATVIRSTGSWYDVQTDDGQTFRCKVKGRFRLQGIRSTNPVCVGDGVTVVAAADGTAYITAIDPRRNVIVRR